MDQKMETILANIIWQDMRNKAQVVTSMSPKAIENIYSITNFTQHHPAANVNTPSRKEILAQQFADNRNESVYGVVKKLDLPTPQKIKTSIFAEAAQKVVHMNPVQHFASTAKQYAEPKRRTVKVVEMAPAPHYSGNVIPLYPRHRQAI